MPEIFEMQARETDDPDAPDEEKASNVSYVACNNSFQSQAWCWRW